MKNGDREIAKLLKHDFEEIEEFFDCAAGRFSFKGDWNSCLIWLREFADLLQENFYEFQTFRVNGKDLEYY